LINKIAAGEVIERPASIVKELIENSIDANASSIFIEAKEGGKSYLKISDNGKGMNKVDAKICWHRHSTSKIKNSTDLFSINTLGFRGEALASIASVSDMTIITKTESEISGIKINILGGKEILNETTAAKTGTNIEIKNLFFNTPARKKYLKTIETELNQITDIITRYALIYPKIHFKFKHENKEILNFPVFKDNLSNISSIYGKDIAKNLIKIDYSNIFKIKGYVSKPSLSRSNRSMQSIYVNNRYIKKNTTISSAIEDAFHSSMMVNRHPITILSIDVDSNKTDVNVHPQKAEIRIQNEKDLYKDVYDAIRNSLENEDLIVKPLLEKKVFDYNFDDGFVDATKQKLLIKEENSIQTSKQPDMKILGIIKKTYIVAEIPGNIILIDQHAAAERILYENYTNELKNNEVITQELLDPAILELTPKQFLVCKNNIEKLGQLGFITEEFGTNTVIVRTIPIILGRQFDKSLFFDFLLEIDKGKLNSLHLYYHERIARMSCRNAIKAGDTIELPQIKKYVQEIFSKGFPSTCPHGRPIVIKWSFYDLEKMFKRVV
jgi:DNA mismatch repair protein MutL